MNEAGHWPWPQAAADVALMRCVYIAGTDESLVANFCRLKEFDRNQFLCTEEQREDFLRFVFDVIYSRLPEDGILKLRLNDLKD